MTGRAALLRKCVAVLLLGSLLAIATAAGAHDVADGDKAFVQTVQGPAFFPFMYLGAKHMVTGYDHILFLVGVVFYLRRLRDVLVYVSLFTLGHSLTLLFGVLTGTGANPYLIDAIIALSVVYKAVENLGGFQKLGLSIDTRFAVLVFGLFHGMGLASKLVGLGLPRNGLAINLIGFNIGVEAGQTIILALVVPMLAGWRNRPSFARGASIANFSLLAAGLLLMGSQIMAYGQS